MPRFRTGLLSVWYKLMSFFFERCLGSSGCALLSELAQDSCSYRMKHSCMLVLLNTVQSRVHSPYNGRNFLPQYCFWKYPVVQLWDKLVCQLNRDIWFWSTSSNSRYKLFWLWGTKSWIRKYWGFFWGQIIMPDLVILGRLAYRLSDFVWIGDWGPWSDPGLVWPVQDLVCLALGVIALGKQQRNGSTKQSWSGAVVSKVLP